MVSSHKFLGVMLDQELRWGPQANYVVAKATKWTLAYWRLARPSTGIWLRLMRQPYNAVAVLKMIYATDVWYMPMYLRAGRERHCGSVGITGRLASVQCLASTTITGTLCSMATDILDLHANLPLVELMLHKVCQRAAVWLATLPASHPLLVPFKTRAKRFIKTHRSPLHELAFIYNISPSSFETLTPARALPRCRNKFTTVPFGMEESIEWDRGNKADICIYTDRSGLEGNAGTAAVLFQGCKAPKSLWYHLSSLDEHTTFKSEAVRLILGAHLLSMELHISTITIGTDSQAALLALNIRKPGPGQQLIDKFLHATRHIQSLATLGNYALELAWVKGHADSIGNSQVDVEARVAATDKTNLAVDLPSFLSGEPLPMYKLISSETEICAGAQSPVEASLVLLPPIPQARQD